MTLKERLPIQYQLLVVNTDFRIQYSNELFKKLAKNNIKSKLAKNI
jgi:hypothetical protein